jgi:hypothetical protein
MALITLIVTAGLQASSAQSVAGVDHYLFYATAPTYTATPGLVGLTDQSTSLFPLTSFVWSYFGSPVDMNGEGLFDSHSHLSTYQLPDLQATPEVDIGVTDQFGTSVWTVSNARFVLLPATMSSPGAPLPVMNHYLCYDVVAGPDPQVPVTLADEFDTYDKTVRSANFFCVPAEKWLEGASSYPIVDSVNRFAVYQLGGLLTNTIYPVGLTFEDQFLQESFTITRPMFLAVPAQQDFPVHSKESTWGGIKSIYR